MFSPRLKTGYFILEALNSFASVYYLYYVYFFMEQMFGFGNKANLLVAALNGAIYAFMAWQGGKFAQRFGYFTSLKVGLGIMTATLAVGSQVHTAGGQILVLAVTVAGVCFTWPSLEALVSEGEGPARLPRAVGVYNIVWAATAALAYFAGGAILEKLGWQSLFYVPVAILLGEFCLTLRLESQARWAPPSNAGAFFRPTPGRPARPAGRAKVFLRLAWVANPFAYIAINTFIAVMPGIARRLELSTMAAGFCCSFWCFTRLGAFFVLWQWPGWHYRFRWLLTAYVALVGAFAATLMAPGLGMLVVAQVAFGIAVGLIYYSSLFYSMDLGDTKGEHGGLHEAAIGLGNFAGPAVGAASLHFLPQHANSGAIAVSGLLLLGLGGMLAIWRKSEDHGRTGGTPTPLHPAGPLAG